MKNRYVFVFVLLAVILLAGTGLAAFYLHQQNRSAAEGTESGSGSETSGADTEFTVVTSFYPMYIAAENVIGGCVGVRLENLSEPQTGCLHDYQLTTEDMRLLAGADVFVVNGGGIETFLTQVAEQYPDLTIIYACEGIEMDDENAHVWMNIENYMQQVQNICDGLAAADEAGSSGTDAETNDGGAERSTAERAETYRRNTAAYIEKLNTLADEAEEIAGQISGRPVVLFHEAYGYLAEELGLRVVGVMDLDEERQVSAGEVADILSVIGSENVPVIFAEELYAGSMGDLMEEESDVSVLYLDPLTRGDYDADSYIDGMRENLALISEAYIQ